jgi:anti-sigma B factor antagonist
MSAEFDVARTMLRQGLGLVEVSGEVDIYTAPRLKDEIVTLIDEGAANMVVDLSKVTFIDSTALGVLIGGIKRVHTVGGELVMVAESRPVQKILAITGLDKVFVVCATRDEALATF